MTADAVGGVWQYATDLARALVPHGVETTVAVLGPALSDAQRAEARGIAVIETGLPLDWLCDGPEPVLAAGEAVAALARDLGVEMVQLNSPALAARARFDRPVVAVAHGCVATWWQAAFGCAPEPGYAWQGELMRAGLSRADLTVAPSASFADTLARTYRVPAPVAVHNGRNAPVDVGGAMVPHVLTAGRLWDRVKRTDLLDAVAARLPVPFRAAGPVRAPHGDAVTPRHLHLLGTLSADALAAELAVRPVFVSAASFEPFGLAVLEAAAAGCALVLSDIPTFRELWDGAAVFVGDDDYAQAIEALLADPARRAALGEAAAARAARYTPAATAAAMADHYRRLLDRRAAA